MSPDEIQQLIQQLMASRGQAQRQPVSGGGFQKAGPTANTGWGARDPKALEQDKLAEMQSQYNQWLGTGGIGGIGPDPGSAPPWLKEILWRPGMKLDPTQYHSVGGYTPKFAQAVNDVLYPGMSFRTGEQSMGQILGKPAEAGRELASGFNVQEYSRLMQAQNDPRIDRDTKKRLMEEYLKSGGNLL